MNGNILFHDYVVIICTCVYLSYSHICLTFTPRFTERIESTSMLKIEWQCALGMREVTDPRAMRAPNSVANAVGDINRTLLGSLGNEDEAKRVNVCTTSY